MIMDPFTPPTILHEYDSGTNKFVLWSDGKFTVNGQEKPWYTGPDGKAWFVKKRKSFVSLVKQAEREGDYD